MIIRSLGDRAVVVDLGEGSSREPDPRISEQVHALARGLDALRLPGIVDLIPAYGTLTVVFDPLRLEVAALEQAVMTCRDEPAPAVAGGGRAWEIPVVYGGARGPDLEAVAALHGLESPGVVALHTGRSYRVYAIGFMPGFPYLGIIPDEIATPRLDTPRPQVPRGSVAIAGRQTGIYPAASPGGWRILGWTPVTLFDPMRTPPSLLGAGDEVRFVPVSEKEAAAWQPSAPWR